MVLTTTMALLGPAPGGADRGRLHDHRRARQPGVAGLDDEQPADVLAARPGLPLEFIHGLLAATIVFAWANAGLVVAAPLILILAVMIPLSRTVATR
jgi:hypothetical protein